MTWSSEFIFDRQFGEFRGLRCLANLQPFDLVRRKPPLSVEADQVLGAKFAGSCELAHLTRREGTKLRLARFHVPLLAHTRVLGWLWVSEDVGERPSDVS